VKSFGKIVSFSLFLFLFLSLSLSLLLAPSSRAENYWQYKKVKILATTYFTHRWSATGRYRQVSKNGKRLGEFVALNFLPGGSIVMIPELFKTTKLEVADTFGGSGVGKYKGQKYWKVDILRDKGEWIDDLDHPLDLYIVKYNKEGPVKNKQVRKNCQAFL
jgi:hypothetical protein